MKESKWTFLSALILSVSLIFSSVYVVNSLKSSKTSEKNTKSENINSILVSKEEAAQYLNISLKDFNKILQDEAMAKAQVQVYDSNRFIAYVEINNTWYYSKAQIDKWIEYHLYNKP